MSRLKPLLPRQSVTNNREIIFCEILSGTKLLRWLSGAEAHAGFVLRLRSANAQQALSKPSESAQQTISKRPTNAQQTLNKRSTSAQQTFRKRSANAQQTLSKRPENVQKTIRKLFLIQYIGCELGLRRSLCLKQAADNAVIADIDAFGCRYFW